MTSCHSSPHPRQCPSNGTKYVPPSRAKTELKNPWIAMYVCSTCPTLEDSILTPPARLPIFQLFIPHTQIYALRDTIPFHLHLRGSAESLRLFLGKTIKRAASSSQSDAFDPPSPSSPTIRVYIRRQVSVVVKGIRAYQGLVIGEGKLKAVERPPEWSPVSSSEEQHRTSLSESVCDYSLDWEGEVKCNDDVHVPSFVSGDIHVKVSTP